MKKFIVWFLDGKKVEVMADQMVVRDGAIIFSRPGHSDFVVSLAGARWSGQIEESGS